MKMATTEDRRLNVVTILFILVTIEGASIKSSDSQDIFMKIIPDKCREILSSAHTDDVQTYCTEPPNFYHPQILQEIEKRISEEGISIFAKNISSKNVVDPDFSDDSTCDVSSDDMQNCCSESRVARPSFFNHDGTVMLVVPTTDLSVRQVRCKDDKEAVCMTKIPFTFNRMTTKCTTNYIQTGVYGFSPEKGLVIGTITTPVSCSCSIFEPNR